MAAVTVRASADSPEARAAQLFEQYGAELQRFCMRRLRSREEAEDAVQNTFLRVYNALRKGIVPELESAWLYKIAHNVCLSRIAGKTRLSAVEKLDDGELLERVGDSRRDDVDELFGLDEALAAMPDNLRNALLLREWKGLSYAEIAETLGVSQSAVETLIFRARRHLAGALQGTSKRPLRRVLAGLNIGSALAAVRKWIFGASGTGKAVTAAVAIVAAAGGGGVAVQHALSSPPTSLNPGAAAVASLRNTATQPKIAMTPTLAAALATPTEAARANDSRHDRPLGLISGTVPAAAAQNVAQALSTGGSAVAAAAATTASAAQTAPSSLHRALGRRLNSALITASTKAIVSAVGSAAAAVSRRAAQTATGGSAAGAEPPATASLAPSALLAALDTSRVAVPAAGTSSVAAPSVPAASLSSSNGVTDAGGQAPAGAADDAVGATKNSLQASSLQTDVKAAAATVNTALSTAKATTAGTKSAVKTTTSPIVTSSKATTSSVTTAVKTTASSATSTAKSTTSSTTSTVKGTTSSATAAGKTTTSSAQTTAASTTQAGTTTVDSATKVVSSTTQSATKAITSDATTVTSTTTKTTSSAPSTSTLTTTATKTVSISLSTATSTSSTASLAPSSTLP